jgi:hypothetical protein
MAFITWINGKKTYIVAAATILYAAVQLWQGQIDQQTFVNTVEAALGLAALRHGVAKS